MENKPILASLTISLALLIFILSVNSAAFSGRFYEREFLKHDVGKNVHGYLELHQSVINFIKGESGFLPDRFNEREKQHLQDVRRLVLFSRAAMYLLMALSGILLILSANKFSKRAEFWKFIGNALFFSGLSALLAGIVVFSLVSLSFSSSFDSFHKLFFHEGTYSFDPDTEIIVNIYPEGLFLDLGLRIAKFAAAASLIIMIIGAFLVFKNKRIK
ncbi:DUF1461 domain-containing protein [Candidatus Woesearchaeota archaeon]|nr:DUF1461 domain-containing protein [Candidatus Woesearchaeota archaeon]